jgi:hypothetical protein
MRRCLSTAGPLHPQSELTISTARCVAASPGIASASLAILILFALAPPAHATPIVDRGLQSMFGQSLFADLAVQTVAFDFASDPDYQFAYTGSTVGSTWQGTFAGDISSLAATGSINGHFNAPTAIDPEQVIDGGSLSIGGAGGTPYALSGSFTFDDQQPVADLNFTLTHTVGGVTTTLNWTNNGKLSYTFAANNATTLSGTVTQTRNGLPAGTFDISITFTPRDIRFRDTPYTITSTSTQRVARGMPAPKPVTNTGRGMLQFFTGFDGDLDLEIQPAPEPSTVVLVGLGAVALFAMPHSRRRRQATFR